MWQSLGLDIYLNRPSTNVFNINGNLISTFVGSLMQGIKLYPSQLTLFYCVSSRKNTHLFTSWETAFLS